MPARRWIVSTAAVLVLVGSLLPWLRSGTRNRSSYDLFQIVDRLGFSPDGSVGWAVRVWPLLPLLLVLVVIAHWLPDDTRAVSALRILLTLAAALYAGGTAVAILSAPRIGLFSVRAGPWITLLGAVGLLYGTVGTRRSDRGESSS